MNKTVYVSKTSFESNDPFAVISSNISVVNVLLEEGYDWGKISEPSKASYQVDYFYGEVMNGGFAQYVYNTKGNKEQNRLVKLALAAMGSMYYLRAFENLETRFNGLSFLQKRKFFKGDFFGTNKVRDTLNDDSFDYDSENLIKLHSKWLKELPDLQVLALENLYQKLGELVGHSINK